MEIGRRIYFEKTNGIVIWDKGEACGSVVETTFEEDCQAMPILTLIEPEQLGIKQLNYGEFREDFQVCRGYKINPQTEQIEFIQTV